MRLPLLLPLAFFIPALCVYQAVTVKGIVNCRGQRQPGTFVQLYDEDSIFDDDDLLGSVIADHRGVFCVKGFTDEISIIEPYILIEHNCGYEGLNEKRTFTRAIPVEYIFEGKKAKHVYHMGDIELLTPDAPVQKYEKRMYIETSIDERIRQCIPVYVQYKRFYEKTVFESSKTAVELPVDKDMDEPVIEPTNGDSENVDEQITEHPVPINVDEKINTETEEERLQREEQRLEEEEKRLEEIRRLEEEKIRLEEVRRIEEEKKRIEELRRQEEENQRKELARREEERLREEERRAEEERRRIEEFKIQEERRKEQEEEHKKRLEEYYKREQERQESLRRREEELRKRMEEQGKTNAEIVAKPADPCVHYPIVSQNGQLSRSMEVRHEYIEDPCLRK
ncbi:unnamed protein product [Caenorhabditis bovis]|uniref:Uncharacterized protein n=1 Tax=Caenorhabditis bovis TaxID=2654633 RepID=A0A8S1EIU3_9PELO|nr:unnamed protein product [Caenorhabditis bovis]